MAQLGLPLPSWPLSWAGLSCSCCRAGPFRAAGFYTVGPRAPEKRQLTFSDSVVLPCTCDLFPRMTERCFTVWMPQFAYSPADGCWHFPTVSQRPALLPNKAEVHLFCFIALIYVVCVFNIWGKEIQGTTGSQKTRDRRKGKIWRTEGAMSGVDQVEMCGRDPEADGPGRRGL